MTSLLQDLRYGVRMLLKQKSFTAVATVTLALGIGANTAMFSVLNTYLFRSLPYPESSKLVRVFRTSPHSQSWPHSAANFLDQNRQNTVFEKMAAYYFVSRNLAEQGHMVLRLVSRLLEVALSNQKNSNQAPTTSLCLAIVFGPGASVAIQMSWDKLFS